MRTLVRIATVVTVLSLGLVSGSWLHDEVRAQEATPPSADGGMGEGVTFEFHGMESGVVLPSPAELVAVSMTLEPGAALPLEESDPTGGIVIVESGSLTVVIEGTWRVTRSAGIEERMATAEATGAFGSMSEEVAAGAEATLETGDVAYIPGSVNGEIRNDGDEPAVGYAVLIGPVMMGGMEATPAP